MKASFRTAYEKQLASANGGTPITSDGRTAPLKHGGVVIAAITSCTNTSNPSVMLAAGLLAKKAVARGLKPKPYVKTSLAPGLARRHRVPPRRGLLESLDALKFDLVGYGCTTCIAAGTPVLMANGMARRIEHRVRRATVASSSARRPTTDSPSRGGREPSIRVVASALR